MKLWTPWIDEVKAAIGRYARFIFAALVLNFLVLANVLTVLLIISVLKAVIK